MEFKYVLWMLFISFGSTIGQVPNINDVIAKEGFNKGADGLINIWQHALRIQPNTRDAGRIQTVLTPESVRMINLVPQDSAHPLYDDSASNSALRLEFLQDYMVLDSVDPSNSQLLNDSGLTTQNLNGNNVNFKKTRAGSITVNGIPVIESHKLSDGTNLYILDGFLFGHDTKVRKAWEELTSQRPSGCGWC